MVLLKRIYDLELKIDRFLDLVSECGLLFEQFVAAYIQEKYSECEHRIKQIRENERLADDFRVQIEQYVYIKTLIPDNRGDVLAVLEGTDEVIDHIKELLIDMFIEKPFIPEHLRTDIQSLATASAKSVTELVVANRAFFYNIHQVTDAVHKVLFWEKEADDIAERVKTELYQSEVSLAQKNHCKYYVRAIEKISDYAQNVADRLTIYTIKREL